MKINNMTAKTSLEIQDTDILVIQDGEDTKQVTVADLRAYMIASGLDKNTKILINETLDNIAASILASKYVVSELKSYTIKTWIDSVNGTIQIALKDAMDKWLTVEDIFTLFATEDEHPIQVLIAEAYLSPEVSSILAFNAEYPDNIDSELVDAGFIRLQYNGLTQNEIAGITYDDIKISLAETEEFRYEFIGSPDLFENSVPYEESIG